MRQRCIVSGCTSGHNRDEHGIQFFSFPKITYNKLNHTQPNLISVRRLEKWKTVCKIDDTTNLKNCKICSKHFVRGRPAKKMNMFDVDWVPTLYLDESSEKNTEDEIAVEAIQENVYDDFEQIEEEEDTEEQFALESEEQMTKYEEYYETNEFVEDDHLYNEKAEQIETQPPPRKIQRLHNSESTSRQNVYTEVITLPLSSIDEVAPEEEQEHEEEILEEVEEEEEDYETQETESLMIDKMCQTDLTSADIQKYILFYKNSQKQSKILRK